MISSALQDQKEKRTEIEKEQKQERAEKNEQRNEINLLYFLILNLFIYNGFFLITIDLTPLFNY
jgi:heme/copper-type cytochrome/quinol oxidase subunit 3